MGDTDAALLHQARISREVQQELMRVRAVPFANLNERLYRIVRQTARELGKKAELEIEGAEVELDRSVLDRIGAPLEHMLRNALAHGIEDAGGARRRGQARDRPHRHRAAPGKQRDRAGASPTTAPASTSKRCAARAREMGLLPADREPTEARDRAAHLRLRACPPPSS